MVTHLANKSSAIQITGQYVTNHAPTCMCCSPELGEFETPLPLLYRVLMAIQGDTSFQVTFFQQALLERMTCTKVV